MKRAVCAVLGLVLLAGPTLAAEQEIELKTEKQKLSYALGLDLGAYFKNLDADLDLDVIHQGTKDFYTGAKVLITVEEAAEIQKKFAVAQRKKEMNKAVKMQKVNKDTADTFLKENKGKDGVKTTDSGLQYKVVQEGKGGDKPKSSDTVKVHYKGTLLDGTEFDSSYKRDQPATFPVDQVIAGWTEALQLMTVGSKYELYLAPDLAYGDRGAPPKIGPGSLLIFEVELLEVVNSLEKEKK
jgi:FKBP-type peptidyl-prolyl cis-trans isomerase